MLDLLNTVLRPLGIEVHRSDRLAAIDELRQMTIEEERERNRALEGELARQRARANRLATELDVRRAREC